MSAPGKVSKEAIVGFGFSENRGAEEGLLALSPMLLALSPMLLALSPIVIRCNISQNFALDEHRRLVSPHDCFSNLARMVNHAKHTLRLHKLSVCAISL